MALKYKCLILDHDDTGVKSTPNIHYPSFVEALQDLRPNDEPITFEEFVRYWHYNPGFSSLCTDILSNFQREQNKSINKTFRKIYCVNGTRFFIFICRNHSKFKKQGGIVTVVSHSERSRIERDYSIHCGFVPDAILDGNY